jgi:two-component system chemotaxis response regulator CheB
MDTYGLVAIAASAGGIPALRSLLSELPPDLPVPVAVVLHRPQREHDLLPGILRRYSTLPVLSIDRGQPMRPGSVHVAPAHAAQALGLIIGIVLTGMGRDATDGVQAVKQAGGVVIAQDEATSEWFGMPGSAIATGAVEYVLPLPRIVPKLMQLLDRGTGLIRTAS